MITFPSKNSSTYGAVSVSKEIYSDTVDVFVMGEAVSVVGSDKLTTGSAEADVSYVISSGSERSDFRKETETSTFSGSTGLGVLSLLDIRSTSSELLVGSSGFASSPVNGERSQSITDYSLTYFVSS